MAHTPSNICLPTSRYLSYRGNKDDLALDYSTKLAYDEKLKEVGFNIAPVIMNFIEDGFGLLDRVTDGAQGICDLCLPDVKTWKNEMNEPR